MTTFALTIRLGNDLMQTSEDVASALDTVGTLILDRDLVAGSSATIRDVNGNRVGEWFVVQGDAQIAHMTPDPEPHQQIDETGLAGSLTFGDGRARPHRPHAARPVLP